MPHFWRLQIREQGEARGTCVAHAAAACCEFLLYAAGRDPDPDLSPQFLQWAIKKNTADPKPDSDGTKLVFASEALKKIGICNENTLRYATVPQVPLFGPDPPQAAFIEARDRKFDTPIGRYVDKPTSGAANTLYEWLSEGPVAIAVNIFVSPEDVALTAPLTNWTDPSVEVTGAVLEKPDGWVESPGGGHCVCVVGFQPSLTEPSGGYFIFRNSWGGDWATSHHRFPEARIPFAGYGAISATYIENHCWELLQLQLPR